MRVLVFGPVLTSVASSSWDLSRWIERGRSTAGHQRLAKFLVFDACPGLSIAKRCECSICTTRRTARRRDD